jgi:SAM-dependent methyltransferase
MKKLHLGAYHIVHKGWINTDVTWQIFVARVPGLATLLHKLKLISTEAFTYHRQGLFRQIRYLNVVKRFSFADNTFDYVYSSHMLEHLCPDEAESCLREVYRVMKPGGVLRLALPDLDYIIEQYDPTNPEATLVSIYQGRSRKTNPLARHWWHYNAKSLAELLQRLGFRELVRCEYQQGRCAEVEIIDHRPNSLFMEGVK